MLGAYHNLTHLGLGPRIDLPLFSYRSQGNIIVGGKSNALLRVCSNHKDKSRFWFRHEELSQAAVPAAITLKYVAVAFQALTLKA